MVTPAVLRKLKASKKKLQRKAEAEKEVTVAMIKADAGVVASDRVVLDAHSVNVPCSRRQTYRKGRSGPQLVTHISAKGTLPYFTFLWDRLQHNTGRRAQ